MTDQCLVEERCQRLGHIHQTPDTQAVGRVRDHVQGHVQGPCPDHIQGHAQCLVQPRLSAIGRGHLLVYHLAHQGHPVLIPQGQGRHLQTGPGRGNVICVALDAEEAGLIQDTVFQGQGQEAEVEYILDIDIGQGHLHTTDLGQGHILAEDVTEAEAEVIQGKCTEAAQGKFTETAQEKDRMS